MISSAAHWQNLQNIQLTTLAAVSTSNPSTDPFLYTLNEVSLNMHAINSGNLYSTVIKIAVPTEA
jgi:hypothetical protein